MDGGSFELSGRQASSVKGVKLRTVLCGYTIDYCKRRVMGTTPRRPGRCSDHAEATRVQRLRAPVRSDIVNPKTPQSSPSLRLEPASPPGEDAGSIVPLRRSRCDCHSYLVSRLHMHVRYIDLFAGIGGFRHGFESAVESADGVTAECVFTCEWDRFARETYRANFGDVEIAGDINDVIGEDGGRAHEVPDHDLLFAGFPCQPFSLAGVSKKNSLGRPHGFEDRTQGTLFYSIAKILKHKEPKAFLLENVKNLLSHDGGETFREIRRTLEDELEYSIKWTVIDAKGWVPQHRERVFIAGFRSEVDFSFDSDVSIPDPAAGPRLESVLHAEDGDRTAEPPYTDGSGRVIDKYVLSDKLWQYLKDYAAKHRARGNGFGYGLVSPDDTARTLSARYYKDGSEILLSRGEGRNPRRLTPRECARLMGFDRPGHEPVAIPVSDTQAYKQFGNAVAVPVVESIMSGMLPFLRDVESSPRGQSESDSSAG